MVSQNHLNIAQVYGMEESGGAHFLVTELVPDYGEDRGSRVEISTVAVYSRCAIVLLPHDGPHAM